jgi:hypothetical protein
MVRISDPNLPTTRAILDEFADRHTLQLPLAYISFLLQNNGGRPTPAAFPIRGLVGNPFGMIKVFFGVRAEIDSEDLELILIEECEKAKVPKGILPVASTDCGDFLCIDLRKPGCPVVFWDRKASWGNDIWNEHDLYPAAESFEILLSELFDYHLPA